MPSTIFTISPNVLRNLDQNQAVAFFRKLLWAEVGKIKIAQHLVKVPSNVNVGDGGLDACITGATHGVPSFVPYGDSGYQIKAVQARDLAQKKCREELHVGEDLNNSLKPEIEKLLQNGGKYFLVIFDALSGTMRRKREDGVEEEFVRYGYSRDMFEILDVDQLASFGEQYPAVVSWINQDTTYAESLTTWSRRREIFFPNKYFPDDKRTEVIEDIRNKLRNPMDCPIIRIMGLSGLGKTRSVYEALSSDEFKDRVLYTEAFRFLQCPLFGRMQSDENLHAILVVDECSLEQHKTLVSAFSTEKNRLSLITISNDFGSVPSPTVRHRILRLEKDKIKELLKEGFDLPFDIIDRLAEFADGYPGIAALLASNYATFGTDQDDYICLSDQVLIDKLISGGDDVGADEYRLSKKVLTAVAVFSKIGYKGKAIEELRWLCDYFEISESDFRRIIEEQRKRGLIEGDFYVSVRPFMLKVTLFTKWWETRGFDQAIFREFIDSIPEAMQKSLISRLIDNIPYLGSTVQGVDFVKTVLSSTGFFADDTVLENKLGSDFFLKLTEANAEIALQYLNRTVATWSLKRLFEFREGRQNIVWSLEKICVWKELFQNGARILLKMAITENDRISNNATGTFAGLFSPGPGGVAPTEASLKMRYPILSEALMSSDKNEVDVAIKAVGQALETGHFSRTLGAEYQGLRKEPRLWRPQSKQDYLDYFLRVWKLATYFLSESTGLQKNELTKILVDQSRGLLHWIPDEVIFTLKAISVHSLESKQDVIKCLTRVLHYDGKSFSGEMRIKIEQLKSNLIGEDFHSRLRRYAGMNLIEDEYDEDGKPTDVREIIIKELAVESLENRDLFKPELVWLTTHEAKNGGEFGYQLGLIDDEFALWPAILKTMKTGSGEESDLFVGGYLRGRLSRDLLETEKIINQLSEDGAVAPMLPGLIWRTGLTDSMAELVLRLATEKKIEPEQFSIFCYGSAIEHLDETVFVSWIKFLLESNTLGATLIVLDFMEFYYHARGTDRTFPKSLTYTVLTHSSLSDNKEKPGVRRLEPYNWIRLAKSYIEKYPTNSLNLGILVLDNLGRKDTIFEGYRSSTLEILDVVAELFPREIWKHITGLIGPPIDERAHNITDWLHGHKFSLDTEESDGGMLFFSKELAFEWVDQDVDSRAWYLADFSPRKLFREKEKTCFARELLIRYGDRDDVRIELRGNFWSGGFSGPGSLHYQGKIDFLKDFRLKEKNSNVLKWIDEFILELEKFVQSEKMDEELRGF